MCYLRAASRLHGFWIMTRPSVFALAAAAALLFCGSAPAPAQSFPLDSADGLMLSNVAAEAATLEGKRGVRVTIAPDAERRMQSMTPQQAAANPVEPLAVIPELSFSNGVIEAEIAGAPGAGAGGGARGFVGIAFRVQRDNKTYDAFYLRPTNGRADDQERRNHSAQYISHPAWPWFRLRQETPSKYESYVDLEPGKWTKVRIEVSGDKARLYVHGSAQPTLIVNDLKTGASGQGGVALWLGPGTVGHFRDLKVERK
jgi:hypothetical protein